MATSIAQEWRGAVTLVGGLYTAEERQRMVVPTTADERRESMTGTNPSVYQHSETVTVLMRLADYRCSDCSTLFNMEQMMMMMMRCS